ncbi:MAG: hypothetical protein JWN13_2306 [Betaproteobacteria bacterium]|nr:hypothetical protein [Betaproteobacteria bacterium]
MRYMMMIKATTEFEAGIPPNAALIAGMAKLSQEMTEAGVLLSSGGLQPSATGMRLKYRGGKLAVTDGPFIETKEIIGGFAILQAKSREDALQLANRCLDVHINAGITDFEMEIRPMFDPEGPCAARLTQMQAEAV